MCQKCVSSVCQEREVRDTHPRTGDNGQLSENNCCIFVTHDVLVTNRCPQTVDNGSRVTVRCPQAMPASGASKQCPQASYAEPRVPATPKGGRFRRLTLVRPQEVADLVFLVLEELFSVLFKLRVSF